VGVLLAADKESQLKLLLFGAEEDAMLIVVVNNTIVPIQLCSDASMLSAHKASTERQNRIWLLCRQIGRSLPFNVRCNSKQTIM